MPTPGARVAVLGCGTSLHMARAVAGLREGAGAGETDAFAASEIPTRRSYDEVVAISRSGTTTEVVRALSLMNKARRIAVVGVDGSPLEREVDVVIPLTFADERSVVQTRFATSVLALVRSWLGEDLEQLATAAEEVIGAPLPIEAAEHNHFVSLGEGWSVGLADEAALKLREAARAWTESYPAMELRHGPMSVLGPGSVVWALGQVDGGVLEDARRTGATVVGGELDPMLELVRVQRAAVALARARGLDPDRPRNLSRSVVIS